MRLRYLLLLSALALPLPAQVIRVGIIGTDTSHALAFTRILNDPSNADHVAGAKVIAAFKGGSPDIENSRNRVDKIADELHRDWGVEIVNDIPTLCSKVDAVLLESLDGRVHLEQVKQVFAAGKRVFIDKPLAASLEDAREIARLGKQHNVPWFSSSSLRYVDAVEETKVEGLRGAITWGPASIDPTQHLDLSWYAIHPIELLYTIMGPRCVSVHRTFTKEADMIVGLWDDGRIGSVRGIRSGKSGYGAITFGEDAIKQSDKAGGAYSRLMVRIVDFFRSGEPPVPNEVTLEMFAFMDAALRSKDRGGDAVKLR
jgi:hypothetical protein